MLTSLQKFDEVSEKKIANKRNKLHWKGIFIVHKFSIHIVRRK